MLRSALLAACALATCVDHFAAGVEVLVSEGRVVAPRDWVAAASSPALSAFDGQGDPEPVPSVPGLIALAPGGALRVTRARAFREDGARDPSEDVRAAVVTLGAVPESDPESEPSSLRVDVRSVETVEGVVRASFGLGVNDEGEESGETKTAVKTVERRVTTACALRRGARGAWEVARDGSERTCTAKRFAVRGDASAEESAADDADATEGVRKYATRVEIILDNLLNLKNLKNAMNAEEPERPNATVSKASAVSTKRVVSRRVDEIAVVAVDDRHATVPKRGGRIVAKEITLVSRGDLVDLAWSWLARATQCASSVRADIMSQCEFDSTHIGRDIQRLDATFPKETAITVDALVNGCCAAVAAHADAGCACALEVAEGLAPFFFAPASASASARAPSAMARSDAVHAAVATLEALCFGGKGDAGENLEYDAFASAAKKKPTSCVASSATLAATRAVALEGVTPQDRSEPGTTSTTSEGSTHIAASAFASSSSPSPGTSPEEKEYAAFLRWLDGGANAAADASAGFERTSSGSDHLARDRGSASLGDRVTNATTRTNATKGGQRKTKTIPSGWRVAVVVVVASVVVVALLAAVVVLRRVIAERARLPRRGDGSIERANVCAEHAALALENGDEVRLVARRRAGGGADGA